MVRTITFIVTDPKQYEFARKHYAGWFLLFVASFFFISIYIGIPLMILSIVEMSKWGSTMRKLKTRDTTVGTKNRELVSSTEAAIAGVKAARQMDYESSFDRRPMAKWDEKKDASGPIDDDRIQCPNCGLKMEPGWDSCYACGASLDQ